jgi:hypothetical protein
VLADRAPPIDWPIADAAWADLCLRADRLAASLTRHEALIWPAASGPAEVFLVVFASRGDVRAGNADVSVILDATGGVAAMTRSQGAA